MKMIGYIALMVAYVVWAAARLYLIIPAIVAREAAIAEILEAVFHGIIGAIYGGIAFLLH
jgi:hypothetical protein